MILPLLEFRHTLNCLYTAVVECSYSSHIRVNVSAPYIKTETTTALKTILLVLLERVQLRKIGTLKQQRLLAILQLSLAVISPSLDNLEPK